MRWVKTQRFSAGTYTFTATADDGVRVFLDGVAVIDQWKAQPPTTYTATRSVTAGNHEIKMEYFEGTGGAVAKLRVTGAASHLTYRWLLPDGSGTVDPASAASQLMTTLPRDLPPGNTVTVNASVKALAPTDPGGTRTARVLTWDFFNPSSGTYLSAAAASAGVAGLGQQVGVEQLTSDELGLEKFHHYAGISTGAGTAVQVNQHSGNLVWSYDPISNPSRGPDTFLRLTYNSMDTSASAAGFGWSVSAASVMRLGTPLQFHPPGQTWPTTIRLTDGDGTTHTFTLNTHGSTNQALWDYDHPFGVHLYLQKTGTSDPARAWRMTRPDRTEFLFDEDGYQSATRDKNGNELLFTYERRKSNNKPIKFLKYLTDAATRQTLTVTTYAKGQTHDYYDSTTNAKVVGATNLTNPHIIDQIASITDITGPGLPTRQLTFTYSDKGLLKELVDGAGSSLAKTFLFDYDMTQGNKNVKLVKVTDAFGNTNRATSLAYYSPPNDDPRFHWWAKTITNRLGHASSFAYVDPDGPQGEVVHTTVTDAEQHATFSRTDAFGRPDLVRDAKQQETALTWDADHNVTEMREASGAVSKWTYDPKTGFPLTITDAQAVADGTPGTTLAYQTSLNGFVAELTEKRSPQGRTWRFGYDAFGNLTSVTDPKGVATPTVPDDFRTTYTYDQFGQLDVASDANEHATLYDDYDDNGYPKTITDAKQKATRFTYDPRANVLTVTDAKQKVTSQAYDLFSRPGENRVPKNQDASPPEFIVTPAPVYDRNDSVTTSTAPNGAVTAAVFDAADQLTSTDLPKDAPTGPARTVTYTYDKIGNLRTETEPKGTLSTTIPGDFVTTHNYDEIYQEISVVNAEGGRLTYTYDNVGNVVTVADPLKSASADPADFTTRYDYDLSHRVTRVTDALGHHTDTDYDLDGQVVGTTDQQNNTTLIDLDERAMPREIKVPHDNPGGTITYRTTRYEYDEVGNQTRVISPRGVETTDDPEDFATTTVYDELNRRIEQRLPFDRDDPNLSTADVVTYRYDDVGNLAEVSAPPSAGQTVRNVTAYTHFDNGWVRTSTDPWDITTTYDYNDLGLQKRRTITPGGESPTSAGPSSSRTMAWDYFPDGKLKSRSDDGVPVGRHIVLVDNSDTQNVATTGTWATGAAGPGVRGLDYRTHAPGTGTDTFTWRLNVPAAGNYEVFVSYPNVAGAAANAPFKVDHQGGSTTRAVDQTTQAGLWVSLGTFAFGEGNAHKVSLTPSSGGVVVADAVKLVRDNSADVDDESKSVSNEYDPNGNLNKVTDDSSDAVVDAYDVSYDGMNRVSTVVEKAAGAPRNTTTYTYDLNSNPRTRTHERQNDTFTYDPRDMLASMTVTEPGVAAKITGFTYTSRGERLRETRGNGNTVDHTYYLNGLPRTTTEKKSTGAVVASHAIDYNANSHRIRDAVSIQNADNASANLNLVYTYRYDPRDRLAERTKTPAGGAATTETYRHDANDNVVSQTVRGVTSLFAYDRNRLQSVAVSGSSVHYNYDPFGRLDTVSTDGQITQRYTYDGFDRITEHRTIGATSNTTKYAYDPLDRTTALTKKAGAANEKTTQFNYLGLSGDVISEEIDDVIQRSYQYSPWGERLSMVKYTSAGSPEASSYYSYNTHTDVDAITDQAGNTRATYGYTAYGSDDPDLFTGVDKPDPSNPDKEPYNTYRFNAKRVDPGTGNYDMGFRDYAPSLNRFLSRDLYNGALSDLTMATDPWTMNRYAFAGGNPISGVEKDGHCWSWAQDICDAAEATKDFFTETVPDWWNETAEPWLEEHVVEPVREHVVEPVREHVVEPLVDAYEATRDWVVEHKAEIAGFAVGLVVGVGCTALTGGAGAVLCGALAGAAGSFVTGWMHGQRGWDLAGVSWIAGLGVVVSIA